MEILEPENNIVNEKRNIAVERLDALRKEIAQPALEIDDLEKKRKARIENYLHDFEMFLKACEENRCAADVMAEEKVRLLIPFEGAAEYQHKLDALLSRLIPVTDAALALIQQKEAEKAELARLRKEAAEREIQDRIAAAWGLV